MRTSLSFLFFTLSIIFSYSQEVKNQEETKDTTVNGIETPRETIEYKKYTQVLDKELDSYKIIEEKDSDVLKVVQFKLLNENIKNIFNQVVFGNSDLASGTSAFGYSQNTDKTNISASANFELDDDENALFFLTTGASIEGSGSVFEFYSEDSWKDKVSFNTSFVIKLPFGSGQWIPGGGTQQVPIVGSRLKRFREGDTEFNHVSNRRTLQALRKAKGFKYKSIEEIRDKIYSLNEYLIDNGDLPRSKEYELIRDLYNEVKGLLMTRKEKEAYDLIQKELKFYTDIKKFIRANLADPENKGLENYIKNNLLYEFDKKNDLLEGYYFPWIRIGLNIANAQYSFADENIDAAILNNFSELEKTINEFEYSFSMDANYISHSPKRLFYWQFGNTVNYGSYLGTGLVEGDPELFLNADNTIIVRDENTEQGDVLGSYENIDKTIVYGSMYGYFAYFWGRKKTLGFNIAARYNYAIDGRDEAFFINNSTVLLGPVFRRINEDKTSLFFGIDLGWENAFHNQNSFDSFTGRIRVGIPFGIFTKKK
ncbi:hypothetical protein [Aquimarina litoralis]|uniref:hypothetical protein n=1 Tax=Aquimarina litoralis TaxID=584605 RepID=UPI001C582501|nr:hypothetical protein [Aquimarina litoralis]MBW1297027.1 hypothetical protein [Aquimarina litoralis]